MRTTWTVTHVVIGFFKLWVLLYWLIEHTHGSTEFLFWMDIEILRWVAFVKVIRKYAFVDQLGKVSESDEFFLTSLFFFLWTLTVVFFVIFWHVSARKRQYLRDPFCTLSMVLFSLASIVRPITFLFLPKLVVVSHFAKTRISNVHRGFFFFHIFVYSFWKLSQISSIPAKQRVMPSSSTFCEPSFRLSHRVQRKICISKVNIRMHGAKSWWPVGLLYSSYRQGICGWPRWLLVNQSTRWCLKLVKWLSRYNPFLTF